MISILFGRQLPALQEKVYYISKRHQPVWQKDGLGFAV
jgi:hypothetical protein